jgi:hypothetical protein
MRKFVHFRDRQRAKRVAMGRHRSFMVRTETVLSALLIAAFATLPSECAFAQNRLAIEWQSPAQFRQLLKRAIKGTLLFDNEEIEFRAPKLSLRWAYGEIKTFELSGARELIITDYGNRHWHEPGERTFRFTLSEPMPPGTAAAFTARVGRPVINGDPYPTAAVIAELPAHHRERFGGSNGTLRLREDGIDYVAANGRNGRSWRWSDIQTLANPNPWEFRVMAYREIVEFDLKRPLSRELFDRLWNSLYAQDLNVAPPNGGHHQ